ncbi:hypothetical protein, partial [Dysosmobacter sp.]|uniref:hypothetical protein n=1 Tax=Dysosmobacter sp. TaxID=2591382 RepID=UPI003A9494B3
KSVHIVDGFQKNGFTSFQHEKFNSAIRKFELFVYAVECMIPKGRRYKSQGYLGTDESKIKMCETEIGR